MTARVTQIGLLFTLLFLAVSSVKGGIYSTMDAPEEVRFDYDYGKVFRAILVNLQNIPNPTVPVDYPIRRRCMLIELLGRKGALELQTIEEKLNYTTALIRMGKADQAVQVLLPLAREHPEN